MTTIGLMGASNINELFTSLVAGKYRTVNLDLHIAYRPNKMTRALRTAYYVWKCLFVDVVYFTYIRENTGYFAKIANVLGKRVVYHWAGSDVLSLLRGEFDWERWHPVVNRHLAYAPNLKQELSTIGIDSQVFTIVPKIRLSCAKMPDDHAVLISIPDDEPSRARFYGYDTVVQVIRRFPNMLFYVVRSSHPELYNYSNVVFKGKISADEMEDLYNHISIVIRCPKHDGLSLLLMEATIKGKHMIYRFNHPHAKRAESVEEICSSLQEIIRTPPVVNSAASRYGIANYSQTKCLKELVLIIESVTNHAKR